MITKILTERITVTIKQDLLYALRSYSKRNKCSLSSVINGIVEEYFIELKKELNILEKLKNKHKI